MSKENITVDVAEDELKKMIASEIDAAIKGAKEMTVSEEQKKAEELKLAEAEKAVEKAAKEAEVKQQELIKSTVMSALKEIKLPANFPGMPAPVKEVGDKRFFSEVLRGIKGEQYFVKKYELKRELSQDSKTLVEGTPSLGGYLVPDEYSKQIIDLVYQYSIIRPLCRVIPMVGKTINIPVATAGNTAYWIDENAEKTASDLTFSQIPITAYKLCALQKVTDELIADSNPQVDSVLMTMFAKVIANAEDRAFLGGTGGAGDPIVGIKNVAGVVGVPAGAALTFDDVFDAINSVEVNDGTNVSMVYAPRDKKTLRKLKGVDGQYLWASASEKAPDTIDGYPIYKDKNIPTNLGVGGNESYAIVGDFDYALIGDRQGLVISAGLDGSDFSYDRMTYRAVKRVGFKLAHAPKFAVITGILPS